MPVQFKGITEYQRRFRSRSASPHRAPRLAGLRSDQLGMTREPRFLARRKGPSPQPQVSRSLQWDTTSDPPPPPPERPRPPPAPRGPRPPEALGKTSTDPQSCPPTTPPGGAPVGQSESSRPPLAAMEGQQSAGNGVHQVLRRKAGLRSAGQKAGLHKSEYHRQFLWKTPVAGSPLLDAEQMLYTSSRTVPPFKSNPLAMESEYRRNFKGSPPPKGPRFRHDPEQGCEVPLFQQENISPETAAKSKRKKKKRDEPGTMSSPQRDPPPDSPQQEVRSHSPQKAGPSPGGQRYQDGAWVKSSTAGEEGRDTDHGHVWYLEVRELREKAKAYRRRAWGTHFSRLHLNQIQSEQNLLWEPSTPSATASDPSATPLEPTPTSALSPSIQALDLASSSSAAPSVVSRTSSTKGSTLGGAGDQAAEPPKPLTPPVRTPPVLRTLAWGEDGERHGRAEKEDGEREDGEAEDGEAENEVVESADSLISEEGRIPTPELKVRAVQRTHHDRTTPATGGAILVSPPRQRKAGGWVCLSEPPLGKAHSPYKHLRPSPHREAHKVEGQPPSCASPAAGLTTADPLPLREDPWSGQSSPANPPDPAASKPRPSTVGPHPPLARPANGIQGALRHSDFMHNGELGLKRVSVCPVAGSCDEDDRLSVTSWCSAASCSMASAVLERAQKRREDFWGKR